MLQNKEILKNSKNLLAFSAGVDSTALFFLLLEHNIIFDIAIVDYGVREASKEEVAYAKSLAKSHQLQCHLLRADSIETNFEAKARTVRYNFFKELIREHHYTALLTAHHLGDRFEWMLMQFCKGAGSVEMSGMQSLEQREGYQLIRPLLHLEKEELLEYLHKNALHYFVDASNSDEKYKRNEFRHHYAQPMLKKYRNGIKKSFEYLDEDRKTLIHEVKLHHFEQLTYFKATTKRADIFHIDRYFKSIHILITAHEKKLLKEQENLVIARSYSVAYVGSYVFIAPYLQNSTLSKELKEKFRKLKVAPKLRPYLASDAKLVALVSLLLQ